MAAPAIFGVEKPASVFLHLGGALAVVWAVLAMGEVLRPLRLLNVPVGLAVAVGPWVTGGTPLVAQLVAAVAGVAVLLLSLPRGPKKERYGLWERWVF